MGVATMAKRVVNAISDAWNFDPEVRRQRTKAQALYATLPELIAKSKQAAVSMEETRIAIGNGDFPPNYLFRFEQAWRGANLEITAAKAAEKFLKDSAPIVLILEYRRLKKSLNAAVSRLGILQNIDTPDAERRKKLADSNLAALEKSEPGSDGHRAALRQSRELAEDLRIAGIEVEELLSRVAELEPIVNAALLALLEA